MGQRIFKQIACWWFSETCGYERASRNASDPDLSKKLNWEINCLISYFNPQRLQKRFPWLHNLQYSQTPVLWEISHFPRTLKVKLYLIDNSRAGFLYNNNLHQEYPCMIFYLFLPFEFSLNNYTYLCNWMNQGLKKFGLWFISNKSFLTLHWR